MVYPDNLEEKIGFNKIRILLKEECQSPLGMVIVDKMRFSDDFLMVQKLLHQTKEFREILIRNDYFPASNFIDAHPHLDKARIEGTFLTEDEFNDLRLSLQTIFGCLKFFDQSEDEYPSLKSLSADIQIDRNLLKRIEEKIDERGKLRDNASPELQAVRKAIFNEQNRIRKVLDGILRNAKSQGFTNDDVSVTIRNGRMVIPVNAESKRRIKGFIHDESATGQTVYLEPAEVLEINNEIKDLEYQERREIFRILQELTNQVRPHVQALRKGYNFLGIIDFIRAKARFAQKIDAYMPLLEKAQLADWYHARHPLLYLSLRKQGKSIVPLNIRINNEQRIVVISGPNAGGKSVCLKTVALLQYMLQCGLLIPLMEHSKAGIFSSIFIDIGDEQSIENDLSTYSSHLTNMKHFVEYADKKTLFLIDEFGTGTEPQFGGAIAESILTELCHQKAYGIITTHYANLKQFADQHDGVVNAAMRFDVQQLEPTYQLEIGKPGSSFAMEIARKIGLPKKILDVAQQFVGVDQVNFEKLLVELEREKNLLSLKNRSASIKEAELNKSAKEYTELKEYIENQRKILLNQAKEDAKKLLKEANQKIETTIREIREQEASKETTKKLRADLTSFEKTLNPEKVVVKETEIKVELGEIKVGDLVRIKNQGVVAEVLSIKDKNADILIGGLKSTVKISRLEKISRKEYEKNNPVEISKPAASSIDINRKMADFSSNLDLRGKRAEEAIVEVTNFIYDAHMFGFNEVRIVHGKGDGILRKIIRDQLHTFSFVKRAKDEHADRGGAGVTIVEMG